MKNKTYFKAFLSVSTILALFVAASCGNKPQGDSTNSNSNPTTSSNNEVSSSEKETSTNKPSETVTSSSTSSEKPSSNSSNATSTSSEKVSEVTSSESSNSVVSSDSPSTPVEELDVSLLSQNYTYDGLAKSLEITGEVPTGITYEIEYYKNSNYTSKDKNHFEVGKYYVKATFSNGFITTGTMEITAPIAQIKVDNPLGQVLNGKYALCSTMNDVSYFVTNNLTANETIKLDNCNKTTDLSKYELSETDLWDITPVEGKTNVYYLKVGNKYLSASASATSLKLDSAAYEWTIKESSEKGLYYFFNGSRGILLNGTTAFGNYSTSNDSKPEYGKFSLYKLGPESPKTLTIKNGLVGGKIALDDDAPAFDQLYSCDEPRFTLIPDEGKMVTSIKLNDKEVYYSINEDRTVNCTLPKGSEGFLDIVFGDIGVERNISVSPNETVASIGELPLKAMEYTPFSIDLTPTEGYFIKDVLLNNQSIISDYDEENNKLFFKVPSGGDCVIEVKTDKYYNVTTSDSSHGDITLPEVTSIKNGSTIELKVVAENLYELDKVFVNGDEVAYEVIEENNKYYTIRILVEKESVVTASFKEMEKVTIASIVSDENSKDQYFYTEGMLSGFTSTSIRLTDGNDHYVSFKFSATDKTNLEAQGIKDGDTISIYFRYQGNANAVLVDYVGKAEDIIMDESKLMWNAVGSSFDLYYLEEGEEEYVLVQSNIPEKEYEFDDTLFEVNYTFKIVTHSMYNTLQDTISYGDWSYGRTYTLTYNNLGHGDSTEQVTELTKLPSRFPMLFENGYIFDGWYLKDGSKDGDYGEKVTPNSILSGDVTLYAKWRGLSSESTKTLSFKDYASDNSWTNGTKYTEVLIDNTCSLKATAGGTGNSGKYYTANNGTWRIYQTGGGNVTISIGTGTIVSVKITYASSNTGILLLNGNTITSGSTVEVNASSINFTVGNSSTGVTNGQAQITAIEITYSMGGSDDVNKVVAENYIDELLSYGTITKKNLSVVTEVLENVSTFIKLYEDNGGDSTTISNYSSYESYKAQYDQFLEQKDQALEHANRSLDDLDNYLLNESLTSESKLTLEQYNALSTLHSDAEAYVKDYGLNYGDYLDLQSTDNISLGDLLISNYINDNNVLITRNYVYDNVSKFDNYSKNWNSTFTSRILTSGMYTNETPLVTMTYTNSSIQSTVITTCPVSKGGQVIIETPDSVINVINVKLLQYLEQTKNVVIKFYSNDTYISEITSSTFTSKVMTISYNEVPENVNKIIIDLSSDTNLIGISSISLNLSNETNKMIKEDYYASIDSTYTGETLWTSLNELTTSTHTYKSSYADCAYLAYITDEDKDNPGNIVDFYSHLTINGEWDGGKTWNREHLWCQSKAWYGNITSSTTNAGTDLHQLRPLYSTINGSRNNSQYGDLLKDAKYQKLYSFNGTWYPYGYLNTDSTLGTGNGVFEPLDNVKGDVARILMYLLVRYKDYVTEYPITNNVYTVEGTLDSVYALLLSWNALDPVDYSEINRNNAVYAIQGNRNPFIDNPNYANLIWGE